MPKLTLRDLFAIVTLAAVLVAWWVDHSRHASLRKESEYLRFQVELLTAELKKHGVTVNAVKERVTVTHGKTPAAP